MPSLSCRRRGFSPAARTAGTARLLPPVGGGSISRPGRRPPGPRCAISLVTERGIGGMLLQACHARGLVYADRRRNAVFVSRDVSGKATGAEIVGLRRRGGDAAFKAMAPGPRKASGGFWMALDGASPERAVLVESAIDALSVLTLRSFPWAGSAGFAAVSAAGVATSVPRWLDGWRLRRILCGYDADRAGDAAATRLARTDPRVVRCRPAVEGEDWNDPACAGDRGRAGRRRGPLRHGVPSQGPAALPRRRPSEPLVQPPAPSQTCLGGARRRFLQTAKTVAAGTPGGPFARSERSAIPSPPATSARHRRSGRFACRPSPGRHRSQASAGFRTWPGLQDRDT